MNRKLVTQKIEKVLIERLKIIGILLILFGIISFGYSLVLNTTQADGSSPKLSTESTVMGLSPPEFEKDDPRTLLPENIFNFYFVGLIFSSLGVFCLFIYHKKKQELKNIK